MTYIDTQRNNHASNDIKIICINGINSLICKDTTRIVEIKDINNYRLESFIKGIGIHVISVSRCGDRYVFYDNNGNGDVSVIVNNDARNIQQEFFKDAEQLIFVYIRRMGGGNKKATRKRKLSKKKSKKYKQTIKRKKKRSKKM